MAAKNNTFTAFYKGKLIGTRKSPREYTHAVIAQHDIEAARKHAYGYTVTETDRSNFKFYTECATGKWFCHGKFHEVVGDELARAKANIEGGFEAYAERLKARAIAGFEEAVAKGRYEPHVAGWSQSERNAQKMAAQYRTLEIVPAIKK